MSEENFIQYLANEDKTIRKEEDNISTSLERLNKRKEKL